MAEKKQQAPQVADEQENREKKFVVIGAGCAGLSAAYTLQKMGVDFEVYERMSRFGGRCTTYRFDPEHPEYYVTEGPLWTEPCEEETIGLIHELHLDDINFPFKNLMMGVYLDGELHYMGTGGNPITTLKTLSHFPKSIVPQILKFGKNIVSAKRKTTRKDGTTDWKKIVQEYGSMTGREWSLQAGGDQIYDKITAPMARGIVSANIDDMSAIQPIAIMTRINGVAQLKGGHNTINTELYNRVKKHVHLGCGVDEILIEDGAVKGVRLENGDVVACDVVINCAAAPAAAKMMPAAPDYVRKTLSKVTYSKLFLYAFKFDRRHTPKDVSLILIPPSAGSKLGLIMEENTQDLLAAPGSSIVRVFTSMDYDEYWHSMSEEERRFALREEAAKICPWFADEGEVIHVADFPIALNIQPVGQFEAIYDMEPKLKRDVKGLYLAGEYRSVHCSTEGAYRSGRREAEDAVAEMA
ncbi:MAG: FAD-dependent oxidoreductase [Coriobacteriales bacterium]|nr:FAD-dependent oxidoreductase [Coriobacteriales bacterium]